MIPPKDGFVFKFIQNDKLLSNKGFKKPFIIVHLHKNMMINQLHIHDFYNLF
jgi:hypothetical protein